MTPSERVKRILDEAVGRDLSSFERFNFLPSIAKFGYPEMSVETTYE